MTSSRKTTHVRCLTTLAALVCLFGTTEVAAQEVPDPFVAYEESEKGTEDQSEADDEAADANASSAKADTPAPPVPVDRVTTATSEGNLQFSSGTSFSFDRSTNELIAGNEATNSTYLFRLDLGLGYYVWDRVLVEGTAGLMMRRLAREGNASATEQDWVFQARAWYTLPLSERVGLLTGLGVGGYFGSSSRELQFEGQVVNEETNTAGFAGDLMVGPMYMFSDSSSLRVLLDFTWLVGTENVPSLDESLSVSATHFGLGVGYTHSF